MSKLASSLATLLVLVILPQHSLAQIADLNGGGIIGRVFLDRDGDGHWSDGDRGLAGVRILTADGLVLTTDAQGGFHALLLRSGYELGGTQVLVLDRSSLAAGSRVSSGVRRLVELHPAQLSRVDFAVLPSEIALGQSRPVASAQGLVQARLRPAGPGELSTTLSGLVPKNCTLTVDGDRVTADDRGLFSHEVRIRPGVNSHLLGIHCPDGHLEFIVADIHWLRRRDGGDLIVPGPKRSLVTCGGPAPAAIPKTEELNLICRTEPGVKLTIGGLVPDSLRAGSDTGQIVLPAKPGLNRYQVAVELDGGRGLSGILEYRVSRVHWFGTLYGVMAGGLGLGSGKSSLSFGASLGGTLLSELPEEFKLILGGRLQTYDVEGLSSGELALELLAPARERARVGRSPDPERAALWTGDEGRVEALNPSGSRYHLGLLRKKSSLGWGTFETGVAGDDQPGQFRRSLVGAHAHIHPLEDLLPGDEPVFDVGLSGFYSRPLVKRQPPNGDSGAWLGDTQMGAHEEFLATGGTLYFLNHQWIVEGSARVQIELRDRVTGAVVEQRRLHDGRDYQVDWQTGRLLLIEPAGIQGLSGDAVRWHPLGSSATVVTVDYEFLPLQAEETALKLAGGEVRLTGRPTDELRLSGTLSAVHSLEWQGDGEPYRLYRSGLEASWGDLARVWATWADSLGVALVPKISLDGGLSFLEQGLGPDRDGGEALEAGLAIKTEPISGRALFRRQLNGFSDSVRLVDQDLNQFLLSLHSQPVESLAVRARFSNSELVQGRLLEGKLALDFRPLEPLLIGLEGGFQGSYSNSDANPMDWLIQDGQRALVGLRTSWEALPWFTLLAGHQHSVYQSGDGWSGRDLTLTTAGGQVRVFDDMDLRVEGGWGPHLGSVVRLGASQTTAQGLSTFAHTTFSVDGSALKEGGLSSGQSAPVGHGCLISSSQSLGQTQSGDRMGQRISFLAPVGRSWRLKMAYERAELHNSGSAADRADLFYNPFLDRGLIGRPGPGRRNAVFGRLSYLGRDFLASVSGEYRMDEHLPLAWDDLQNPQAATSHRQTVLTLAGRWRPVDALTLAARLAWAETFGLQNGSSGPGLPEGGLFEGSLSLAYRPQAVHWLRLLVRASAGSDHRPPDPFAVGVRRGAGRWVLGAFAAVLSPSPYFQPTLVLAPWFRSLNVPEYAEKADKFEMLGMARLGSEIYAGMGLAGEARLSFLNRSYSLLPEADDEGARVGFAAEIFYRLDDPDTGTLRMSLGYSFSDIPDPLLTDLFADSQGVFLRMEGAL